MANFEESNEIGGFGEQVFEDLYLKLYKPKGWIKKDVREDKEFQRRDIDFLLLKDGYTKEDFLEICDKGNPVLITERREWGKGIEVKTDRRTYETRNLVYEIISHNMPGCMARSYADFLFYVCTDNIPNPKYFKEVFVIDLYELRKFLIKNVFLKKPDGRCAIKLHSEEKIDNKQEDILNLLICVDTINDENVCKDITKLIKNISNGTACKEANS